jgi:hypothetical protein
VLRIEAGRQVTSMARTKEEIAADLIWRYVEHSREASDVERLSDEELEELLGLLKTAGLAGDALETERVEARHAAVRQRVEQLIAASRQGTPVQPSQRSPFPAVVPAWAFRAACAASIVLALALSTVPYWHRVPPKMVNVIKVRNMPELDQMTEAQAHEMLPKLVHSKLSERQEKSLMGHMLVCNGCFKDYVQLRHEHIKITEQHASSVIHRASAVSGCTGAHTALKALQAIAWRG